MHFYFQVYTQEVLAIVLQQLMELPAIPVLFMRTVLQAHTTYPRIIGFVLNILQRLIVKQVGVLHSSHFYQRLDISWPLKLS